MDKTTPLSANTTISSKKLAFSPAERDLIIALVRERPIIEDKRIHAKNIKLKKDAWEDLAVVYNSKPFVSQRLTHQLKRCWENIKTQKKKELSQGSMSLKRTRGGSLESGSIIPDNATDTTCPLINLRVPGVINTITIKTDTMKPHYVKNPESEDEGHPTVKDDTKESPHGKLPEPEFKNTTTKDMSILTEQHKNHSRKRTMSALLHNELDENSYLQPKRKSIIDTSSTLSTSRKFISRQKQQIKATQ